MKNANNIQQLVSDFYPQTKKVFKSCKFATVNLFEDSISDVWGDFSKRADAVEAVKMWSIAFRELNGKVAARVEGRCYRVSITF